MKKLSKCVFQNWFHITSFNVRKSFYSFSTLCPVPLLNFKFAQVEFFMILKQGWILSAYLSHFHGKKVVKLFPSLFNFFFLATIFHQIVLRFCTTVISRKKLKKKNFSSCLSITRIIKRGSHRVSLSKSFSKKSHSVKIQKCLLLVIFS